MRSGKLNQSLCFYNSAVDTLIQVYCVIENYASLLRHPHQCYMLFNPLAVLLHQKDRLTFTRICLMKSNKTLRLANDIHTAWCQKKAREEKKLFEYSEPDYFGTIAKWLFNIFT